MSSTGEPTARISAAMASSWSLRWRESTLRKPLRHRTDVAFHDRGSRATTLITHRANANSGNPRISGNGRFIAFESTASNLACDRRCSAEEIDENLLPDVYVFDRHTARFRRVSGGLQQWWVPSLWPWLDAEGKIVIFSSRQPVDGSDTTTDFDLFVRRLDAVSSADVTNGLPPNSRAWSRARSRLPG